jgi:hypothetical protein
MSPAPLHLGGFAEESLRTPAERTHYLDARGPIQKGDVEMKCGTSAGAVSSFLLAIVLAAPGIVRADAVADWNAITVQATITGARPGPTGVLDIAMVQAAIYDAVQAIEGEYEPYAIEIPGAAGSPVAAAGRAAHDVLVNRFPAQAAALGATLHQYLIDHGISSTDAGIAVGKAAAAGIISLRRGDRSFPTSPPPAFLGGTDPGDWRPTPPGNAAMFAPWLGAVRPFTLRRPSQFRAVRPPALNSPKYTRSYNEVKSLGAMNGSSRAHHQTDLAHFWNLAYHLVWNQVLRDLAAAHVTTISESSRLFALADMVMADAIITAWDSKLHYAFWRPITAIREGDDDTNPLTEGDESWTPLVNSPAYPDYTSGANNISAAAARALALFFGTNKMTFDITTTNTGPTVVDTRTYHSFSEVLDDVVDARIYEGIHFRFADVVARRQGEYIAQWAYGRLFRPVDE